MLIRRLIISLLGQIKASTAGETFAGFFRLQPRVFRTRVKGVMQRALMNWTSGGWQMVWATRTSSAMLGTTEQAQQRLLLSHCPSVHEGPLHAPVKNSLYLLPFSGLHSFLLPVITSHGLDLMRPKFTG